MTAPAIADTLGPRARRRVLSASVVAGLLLALVAVAAVNRLADRGQLSWSRWEPFTQWSVVRFFLGGLANTVKVAAAAMVLAMVSGALLALARLARSPHLRWSAGAYVDFFRGVPVLLLILFVSVGLPQYGVHLSTYCYLVLGLVAYNSAVLGEIFRAGILSLDRGQSEAAHSIGLSYWQTMGFVLIPQAARRMTPAIVSQLVTILKDTALGWVISYDELLGRGRISGSFYQNILQAYVLVALVYILVNFALSRMARRLEVRQRRRYGAGEISVSGLEDLTAIGTAADAEMEMETDTDPDKHKEESWRTAPATANP